MLLIEITGTASVESNSIRNYLRPILYNTGRVISYTVIGGIVGLIGSVIELSSVVSGIIVVAAAVIMLQPITSGLLKAAGRSVDLPELRF